MNFSSSTSKNLCVLSTTLKPIDLMSWVQSSSVQEKFYLKLRDEDREWAGVGNLLENRPLGLGELGAFQNLEKECDPHFFVANSFDLDKTKTRIVLPRFEVTKRDSEFVLRVFAWTTENIDDVLDGLPPFDFEGPSDFSPGPLSTRSDTPKVGEWQSYFGQAMDFLESHSKIVLARVTEATFEKPIDPFFLLSSLKQESYRCYYRMPSGVELVSVSPERLFRLENNVLKTEAVAGTCAQDLNPEFLMNSKKERAEHQYVVDEILRQLEPFTEQVEIKTKPDIVKLKTLYHLKTPIKAKLRSSASLVSLIEVLHPTPAVGGLPKGAALNWLKHNEPFSREYYAAPLGIVTNNFSEFFVNIRSAQLEDNKMKLYTGVGVVKESTAEGEWSELDLKASQFWDVLT